MKALPRRTVASIASPASASDSPQTKARGGAQTGRAALVLREMLLEGHFQPGERIREVPLAAELGVSRIPLRLVLERLAHEGLLVVRSTRGFVVQRFSTADIYDAIELRGLLEGMAARLTAERVVSPADTAKLQGLHVELVRLVRRRKLTLEFLEQRQIRVHVLPTQHAVALYNKLAQTDAVGGLFHTTC